MLSEALRARARELWRATEPTLGPLGPELDAQIRAVPGDRGALLMLACGTLPISDVASVPVSIIDSYGRHALFLREHSPFCRDIPEDMLLHFVWYPRINSEALTDCRAFFYEKLARRVEGLDGEGAILEVNRWCAEHMTYQLSDGRTESPLTAYRSGTGRCGEESVFLTTALRSVGIPARQVYAPWWAHCDDNHAWVEAWDGRRWRYLGACEPEPVLDRGWFCDAAARAPLVHYRAFFDCQAGDPLTERMGSVRLYSVTKRYAETFRLTVWVEGADGRPAPGASVELDVANMAAFRPILRGRTDERGCFTVELGRTDLHVEAFGDGCVAAADVHPEAEAEELRLRLAPPVARSFDCDLTPPPPSGRNRIALTAAQKEGSAAVVAACATARAECAKGWDLPEYAEAEEPWPRFFALAAGNAPELWRFYAAHEGAERALAARMLGAMAEKDCRDARFELLEGHFRAALCYAGSEHFVEDVLNPRIGLEELENWRPAILSAFSPERLARMALRQSGADCPEDRFVEDVLNPRIGLEELENWRPAILSAFTPERLAEFVERPEALMEHIRAAYPDPEGNWYPTLCMTPSAVLATGRSDEKGRQALFVAVLRTLGVPARLDAADGSAQYWRDGAWHPAEARRAATCRLRLEPQPGERFVYEANWSLSRLEGARWRTLGPQGAPDPFQLALRPGLYRLTTANRLPNGRQLCRAVDFALDEGQAAALPLALRAAPPEQMLSRIPLDDIWLLDEAGAPLRAQELPGEILLLAWLDPGTEPTEHILNELLASADAARRQTEDCVGLAFVLRAPAARENATLQRVLSALPRARVLYDASPAQAADLARRLFLEPDVLPLAILLDPPRNARFASAGYQVGLIDLTLKLTQVGRLRLQAPPCGI